VVAEDGERSADAMGELEKRILRLHKGGVGMQRVVMEQLRPFDVDVAEAGFASQ
jgi:hypothetical protein